MSDQSKLSHFWQELKRRRVLHVITVYASASFVIIELINNVLEPLNLPEKLPNIAIVTLAIGFPLAIVLTWIFNISPKGLEETGKLDKDSQQITERTPNSWKIATYVSVVIIVGLLVVNIFGGQGRGSGMRLKREWGWIVLVVAFLYSWTSKLDAAEGGIAHGTGAWQMVAREPEAPASMPEPSVSDLIELADRYTAEGKYSEAEKLYRRALLITERSVGGTHPNVAALVHNIGTVCQSQARLGEAEALYRRSLEILEAVYGRDHPDMAASLNNLGSLYLSQARYGEAEGLIQRALDITEKTLGKDHPDLASSLNALGNLYRARGKYKEAEKRYERALKLTEKARGSSHPDLIIILNNYSMNHYELGKYSDAESMLKRSLEIAEESLGLEHPDVAMIVTNLLLVYQAQGKDDRARALAKKYQGIEGSSQP